MRLGPTILPGGWVERTPPEQIRQFGVPCAAFMYQVRQLGVLMTEEPHEGTKWLHVSLSHPDQPPTWKEIRMVKDIFIGKDRCAVMILPEEEFYVNQHPYCFHLWHRLDGDTCSGNPQRH